MANRDSQTINRQELKSNLDELYVNVEKFRESESFRSMLDFIATFPSLSPYNAFLLYQQRPGTRYVMNAYNWRKKYGREIRPNACPLIVLVPFGPVDFVYDISDTVPVKDDAGGTIFTQTDEEIIKELTAPYRTNGYKPSYEVSQLIDSMILDGIAFDSNLNTAGSFAGKIELRAGLEKQYTSYKKQLIPVSPNYLLSVRKGAEEGEAFATIAHELGHLYCHHLSSAPRGMWETRNLDHATKEFEAESVSYIVCKRFGVQTPSEKYLHGYFAKNKTIPNVSVENIFTACTRILNMIDGLTLKEGLMYKHDKGFQEIVKRLVSNCEVRQPGASLFSNF